MAQPSSGSPPVSSPTPAKQSQSESTPVTPPTANPSTNQSPSLPANSSARNNTTPANLTPEAEAEVEQAITAGDVFFEQGKYDLAIETYTRPLKLDPTNKRLRARIGRARKAKVAEEQYLGSQ